MYDDLEPDHPKGYTYDHLRARLGEVAFARFDRWFRNRAVLFDPALEQTVFPADDVQWWLEAHAGWQAWP